MLKVKIGWILIDTSYIEYDNHMLKENRRAETKVLCLIKCGDTFRKIWILHSIAQCRNKFEKRKGNGELTLKKIAEQKCLLTSIPIPSCI